MTSKDSSNNSMPDSGKVVCGFIGLPDRKTAIHHSRICPNVVVWSNVRQVNCRTALFQERVIPFLLFGMDLATIETKSICLYKFFLLKGELS